MLVSSPLHLLLLPPPATYSPPTAFLRPFSPSLCLLLLFSCFLWFILVLLFHNVPFYRLFTPRCCLPAPLSSRSFPAVIFLSYRVFPFSCFLYIFPAPFSCYSILLVLCYSHIPLSTSLSSLLLLSHPCYCSTASAALQSSMALSSLYLLFPHHSCFSSSPTCLSLVTPPPSPAAKNPRP